MVFVSLAVTNAKAARFAGPAKSNSAIRLVGRAKGSVISILCKGVEVVDNERRVNSPTQRAPIVGVVVDSNELLPLCAPDIRDFETLASVVLIA